jgi:hypothetical protein
MSALSVDELSDALVASLEGSRDQRLREIVARSDCYLAGSYSHGHADTASDCDILAFTEEEWQVEGIIAPFGAAGPRPGPGESLPTMDDVLQWRANAGLGIVEIEVLGPAARAFRERDVATWAFILERAQPLYRGWGGGEGYRESVLKRFEAALPQLAEESLVEFQSHRNQVQTTILHGHDLAIGFTAARTVRAALRAWLLWEGKALPTDKWLPLVVEDQKGTAELLRAGRQLMDPGRPARDRFDDARRLRDLLDRHVRSAGGDPKVLWVWPPKPSDVPGLDGFTGQDGDGGRLAPWRRVPSS